MTARAEDSGYIRVALSDDAQAALARERSTRLLSRVDAIVFDCDGVLIDARRSYDATIRVVVEEMVEQISGQRLKFGRGSRRFPAWIAAIRRTGGFNNDWDTTYALTLFSITAMVRRSGIDQRGAVARLEAIIEDFSSRPRERGDRSVDAFLESGRFPAAKEILTEARRLLGYPGSPPMSKMTTLFDEVYFGSRLFEELHGHPATRSDRSGLIELERTLVKIETIERLSKFAEGRLAMVTGRPFVGTRYSLGDDFMALFDREASTYIGDADLYPDLRKEYERYRKPSGEALIKAAEKLSSKVLLYIGDSAEDLMMARDARKKLGGTLFAGVYETTPQADKQVDFFERNAADIVTESVNQLPLVLEAVMR